MKAGWRTTARRKHKKSGLLYYIVTDHKGMDRVVFGTGVWRGKRKVIDYREGSK